MPLSPLQVYPPSSVRSRIGSRVNEWSKLKLGQQNRLEAALDQASESVGLNTETPKKSTPQTRAYESGKRFRDIFVRTVSVATDKSGGAAKHVAGEIEVGYERQRAKYDEKIKQQKEKYGGPPDIIQIIADGIEQAQQTSPFSRRRMLIGAPKDFAMEGIQEVGQYLIPWPFNRVLKLLGLIK